MPLTRMGARDSMPGAAIPFGGEAEHLGGTGQASGGLAGAGAHSLREEQFAAGHSPHPVGGLAEGSLVGDGKGADVVNLVAPQLDAQWVGFLGREHVEDAAAHAHTGRVLRPCRHARIRARPVGS